MKKVLLAAALLVAAPGLGVGTADAAAIDFTSPTGDFTNNSWSIGFEFDVVNMGFRVTHLGFYDDRKNDLTERHAVGIYNSGGQLLVSGTVAPGDPLGSWFRWVSVTPVVLPVATGYRIAAVTGTENYTWDPNGFTTDPGINFIRSRYTLSNTLVFPVSTDGSTGYFGPNFDGESVPEPSSLLLIGAGLLGLSRKLRRRV